MCKGSITMVVIFYSLLTRKLHRHYANGSRIDPRSAVYAINATNGRFAATDRVINSREFTVH